MTTMAMTMTRTTITMDAVQTDTYIAEKDQKGIKGHDDL